MTKNKVIQQNLTARTFTHLHSNIQDFTWQHVQSTGCKCLCAVTSLNTQPQSAVSIAKGKLTSFTYSSWCKFISFAAKWGRFQCKEVEKALAFESKLRLILHSTCDYSKTTSSSENLLSIPAYCKFHQHCYNRFCNIRMLGREEDWKTRKDKQTEAGMDKQIIYRL